MPYTLCIFLGMFSLYLTDRTLFRTNCSNFIKIFRKIVPQSFAELITSLCRPTNCIQTFQTIFSIRHSRISKNTTTYTDTHRTGRPTPQPRVNLSPCHQAGFRANAQTRTPPPGKPDRHYPHAAHRQLYDRHSFPIDCHTALRRDFLHRQIGNRCLRQNPHIPIFHFAAQQPVEINPVFALNLTITQSLIKPFALFPLFKHLFCRQTNPP